MICLDCGHRHTGWTIQKGQMRVFHCGKNIGFMRGTCGCKSEVDIAPKLLLAWALVACSYQDDDIHLKSLAMYRAYKKGMFSVI